MTCDVKRTKMQSGVQFIKNQYHSQCTLLKQMELHCADFQLNTPPVYNNTINPELHFVLPRYVFF